MKKMICILILATLLAGCSKEMSLETVGDIQDAPVSAVMQRVMLQLPPELSKPTLESEESGTLYLCDDYSVTVQTVSSGDLKKTIRNATGMEQDELQIIKTQQGDVKRYQFMWTASGENGIQVGRGCILDDGAYHYVLTTLADEADTKQVQPAWKEIFTSFRLATEREEISTGS